MSAPFVLFSWEKPFLEPLQEFMCHISGYDLGSSVLVVPHNRPRRYLTELLRKNTLLPKPALLPRMLTIGEMTGLFRAHVATQKDVQQSLSMGRKAALLDCVHILYEAVQKISTEQAQLGGHDPIVEQFAQKDLAAFLPWGLRLMALFEEYMNQLLPVRDILYTEGEVAPMASALLGALGRIHKEYMAQMQAEGWSTKGLDAYAAAMAIQQNPDLLPPLLQPNAAKNSHVFVAGFSTITECEHVLLKALWQQGAHICLHSDPALARDGQAVHYACEDHVTWMRRWKTTCLRAEHMGASGQNDALSQQGPLSQTHRPKMHFFAGYDVHSQLLHMQDVLRSVATEYAQSLAPQQSEKSPLSTAVVLSSSALLMPTLHHLPEIPFNISMGYPLDNSSLFSLLESLLRLQEGARGGDEHETSRRYHWRGLMHALRHPFVQMLSASPPQGGRAQSLHSLLGHVEKALRTGNAFVSAQELLNMAALQVEVAPHSVELFAKVLPCLLDNFATVHSTWSLGQAMSELCHVLLSHGMGIWKSHPLDAESLYRLMQHVIPTLKMARMAKEALPHKALFALCRQLIGAERVPFEAAPMEGLQVLGMLETRLLHFDRLIILDATDDILPGFTMADPLLPDALRDVIGLPALQERERVVAHTLHRLVASAKEVHFCWQEGMQRSELFDAKKSRSRFVDAYLWKEEQERGYILENGMAPLEAAPCVVSPMNKEARPVVLHDLLRQKIVELLQKGISPTKLDSYMRCPQRFVWENIYKLSPLDIVNEGDDPAAVGKLLHEVLQKAYTPWLGKKLLHGAVGKDLLQEIFTECYDTNDEVQALPQQSRMLLRMAAPVRFARYAQAQNEQAQDTEIMALEQDMVAEISGRFGQSFYLKGIMDRVDLRHKQYEDGAQQGLMVLDYKTGRVPENNTKVWEDMELWTAIALWTPQAKNSTEVLEQVAKAFHSVQLPCYIYMCGKSYAAPVLDAGYVDMGDTGEEVYLLGEVKDNETRAHIIEERVPQLISFLLDHMYTAQSFAPNPGKGCKYCPYGALCSN